MRKEVTFEAMDGGIHSKLIDEVGNLEGDLNEVVLRSVIKYYRYYIVNRENYFNIDRFRFLIEETLGDIVRNEMECSRRIVGIRCLLGSAVHNKLIDEIVELTEEMNEYISVNFGPLYRMTEYIILRHHEYLRSVLSEVSKDQAEVFVVSMDLVADKEINTDLVIRYL